MLLNNNDIEYLSNILGNQVILHKKLLDLENQKTIILLDGNIEELDNLVNLEQPLIMSIANIEKKRDLLQKKMDIEGATLKQIVNEYKSNDNKLENKFVELTDIIINLKRVNITNQKILSSRLDVVEFVLFEIGLKSSEDITYKRVLKKQ